MNLKKLLWLVALLVIQNVEANEPINYALELRKEGDVKQSIVVLKAYREKQPDDTLAGVELAASYYMAHDFSRGSAIFKKLLTREDTSETIKTNIVDFVKSYRDKINQDKQANDVLVNIVKSDKSKTEKIAEIEKNILAYPKHWSSRLYLSSLYSREGNISEANEVLSAIELKHVSPEVAERFSLAESKVKSLSQPKSRFSGFASVVLGYDSEVRARSVVDIYDEVFNAYIEDEFLAEFDEEGELTEDEFIEEFFDEDAEEAIEESLQDIEENEFFESLQQSESGNFSNFRGRLDYRLLVPSMNSGVVENTYEFGFHGQLIDRKYQQDSLERFNYQVVDVGVLAGVHIGQQNRLVVPLSIKNIRLEEGSYARFSEAQLIYHYKKDRFRLTLSELYSYRDYERYNDDRPNGTFTEHRVGLSQGISPKISLTGQIKFGTLDVKEDRSRSYDTFSLDASVVTKVAQNLKFHFGGRFQRFKYKGEGEFFIDEDGEEIFEENRDDDVLKIYAKGIWSFTPNWAIHGKIESTDRKSNFSEFEYDHFVVSTGVTVSF